MRETVQAFEPDVPYHLRQRVGPWLTRGAQLLGEPEYELRRSGYVGTLDRPIDEFAEALRDDGFSWGPVSWYHRPPVGTDPNGSWTYRSSRFADRQLHVILAARAPECIDVFAHWEYNWLRHPVKHAKQRSIDRETGSETMRAWLADRGIPFENRGRNHRRARRTVRRLVAKLPTRFGPGEPS